MTEPTPAPAADEAADQAPDPATAPTLDQASHPPTDHRYDPPPSGAELVDERPPPQTEAERQAQATVRSVSRLDESS